jgi:hypothetical protein
MLDETPYLSLRICGMSSLHGEVFEIHPLSIGTLQYDQAVNT